MHDELKRHDGRTRDELRTIEITPAFQQHPESSVLIRCGATQVICAVSILPRVPRWMKEQNIPGGWVTAEYQMLPSSTPERGTRESTRGHPGGRTQEIQRLVGRSLRAMVDLESLGERTYQIDCDVIDADGGTRCAAITGAAVALEMALQKTGKYNVLPLKERVAAVSTGKVHGRNILDLDYVEDSAAEVDMNFVMTESGGIVEMQGTAEEEPFSVEELNDMVELARNGIQNILAIQKKALQ